MTSSVYAAGIVTAWGDNSAGQTNVPAGLSNVVAVAGNDHHSLALRSDGTVAAWGLYQNNTTSFPINEPDGLSNVVAIAAGHSHDLALRADGSVVAWGLNYSGETNVPTNLSNVVSVAAGYRHSLALKSDGTLSVWGTYYDGTNWQPATTPAGLTNVAAVASGWYHSVALRSDGTVAAWGVYIPDQGTDYIPMTVPDGLSNVVAVAGGGYHNLALRSDGTVVAWGRNNYGQATVPAGLSNVVAVAGGGFHSLALRADGSVAAWGALDQASVPATLGNIAMVAGGGYHNLALEELPPNIKKNPVSQSVVLGSSVNFSVIAVGSLPLNYQWYFNNAPINGATGATFSIASTTTNSAGNYSVVVSNNFGTAQSSNATLLLESLKIYAGVNVYGPVGSNCFVQFTSDLTPPVLWTTIQTITILTNPMVVIDYGSADQPHRFYRTKLPDNN